MSHDILIVQGDARHIPLADNSVQCIVTSPPYWGLRKYSGAQDLIWPPPAGTIGMDPQECPHDWVTQKIKGQSGGRNQGGTTDDPKGCTYRPSEDAEIGTCELCGASRGAFGLEPMIAMYVEHSLVILAECRRVLRPDGVIFWNLGDSYSGGKTGRADANRNNVDGFTGGHKFKTEEFMQRPITDGLKPKDLCLIPARVALAAQAMGLWVRSDIIWAKPNPMPESCRDRPTDAYEHILMFTKSARYFWDAAAVREPSTGDCRNNNAIKKRGGGIERPKATQRGSYNDWEKYRRPDDEASRNLRNLWQFATQPYKGAHFATFPEELPRRCILAASRTGDLILDPFAGSGTVGRVAVELNRRAVLMDLAYHDQQDKRTRNVQRTLI